MLKRIIFILPLLCPLIAGAQTNRAAGLSKNVNIFLGTSGDHGQLSPGASVPFGMMDIAPETYPETHTGYEYRAKTVLGFTHNRFEGVGCRGSGGNLLIKPFIGLDPQSCTLAKKGESASPGRYQVSFLNGISAKFAVMGHAAVEDFHLPPGKHGLYFDLSQALANKFIAEEHSLTGDTLTGWIESGTTCRIGAYRVYYALVIGAKTQWKQDADHKLAAFFPQNMTNVHVAVAFSSVSAAYAVRDIDHLSYEQARIAGENAWNRELAHIKVKGDPHEQKLFYSLLYRALQSPYDISEPDGSFRATDGSIQHSTQTHYNGWAIWDNYRTQLPLLSLAWPERYGDIVSSIAGLYQYGKKDWATKTEPSNTVRTEHAVVVLLDAYRKGYQVNFKTIRDSLLSEAGRLDFTHPDKALESSYDLWALSQVFQTLKDDSVARVLKNRAANWKTYWRSDFNDLTRPDVDRLEARGMYQGTIWQYRWFVPFDMKGLIAACGGEQNFTAQLSEFFAGDYYNAANEPDIQAPYLYQATGQPWRSQAVIRKYAQDTVTQYYYDENYRGIDPTIDRVFNNRPDAFIRSMDDDAGAMSSWYVFAACGLSPACPGFPVYYIHVPIFDEITFAVRNHRAFHIISSGPRKARYIRSATLNGKPLERNWITHEEIEGGGTLKIIRSKYPNKKFGITNQFITSLDQ